MRLKRGLCCQTLCVMKSWLFRTALCISHHGQHVQWLFLRVPTSAAGGWPTSSFPGPSDLLRQAGHPGIYMGPPGATPEFSLSRRFLDTKMF